MEADKRRGGRRNGGGEGGKQRRARCPGGTGKSEAERKRKVFPKEEKLFCTTETKRSTALFPCFLPSHFSSPLSLYISLSDGRLPVCSTFFIPLANPTSSLIPALLHCCSSHALISVFQQRIFFPSARTSFSNCPLSRRKHVFQDRLFKCIQRLKPKMSRCKHAGSSINQNLIVSSSFTIQSWRRGRECFYYGGRFLFSVNDTEVLWSEVQPADGWGETLPFKTKHPGACARREYKERVCNKYSCTFCPLLGEFYILQANIYKSYKPTWFISRFMTSFLLWIFPFIFYLPTPGYKKETWQEEKKKKNISP